MRSSQLRSILVIAGAILFNIIFWQEKIALNVLLFDVFILGSVFFLYPNSFKKPVVKWLLVAHIITVAAVVIHNTLLSKMAFSATLLLTVIFVEYYHRSIWYAAASAMANYVLMAVSFIESFNTFKATRIKWKSLSKLIRFLIIPMIIVGIFFLLYSFANVMFQHVINDIQIAVQNFIDHFFSWFSWERFGFLLFGLFITGGLLLKSKSNKFADADLKRNNDLKRKKNNLQAWKETALFDLLSLFMGRFANGVMALRNENTIGIISLALLNILLLFINCLDVVYVWFGFSYTPDLNLTQYVHEGTGMLIFSIVLAMLVLLFFFRGNLNFYKKNKWLRYGAYAWIIQNVVLVISVFIRDYYYIQHMGLAYKRIGVMVFLSMVLVGLFTMLIKIQQRKSNYYLLRVNGWFAMILLVVSSCIHWDEQIAGYNLARKNTIPVDVKFLLTLSDKTLPLIEQNQDVLEKEVQIEGGDGEYLYRSALTTKQLFAVRKRQFFAAQQNYSWLSWNEADEYVKHHLNEKQALSYLVK